MIPYYKPLNTKLRLGRSRKHFMLPTPEDKSRSIADILKIVNVSKSTFYQRIACVKEQNGNKKER